MTMTVTALLQKRETPLKHSERLPSWRPFLISDARPEEMPGFEIMPASTIASELKGVLPEQALDSTAWFAVPEHALSWFELPEMHAAKQALRRSLPHQWRIRREMLSLPAIMGIWNVTPDSFSSSADTDDAASTAHAERLLRDGADILDIGAESTRPDAEPITPEIEIERLAADLAWAARQKTRISLDSWRLETIRRFAEKIDILNDIGRAYKDEAQSKAIFEVVRKQGLGYVMMAYHEHTHQFSSYFDCIREIIVQLDARLGSAFEENVDMSQIVVDPGIGFGKGLENDLGLMVHGAEDLACLGRPVVIAHSRKRCLGLATGRPIKSRDTATAIGAALAFEHGASLVRVHDPRGARDALTLLKATERKNLFNSHIEVD